MRPPNSQPPARVRRVVGATILAALLAATSIAAQFAVFNEGFEGEIWELITTLDLPFVDDGNGDPVPDANWASGVAWVNGELFIADNYATHITKYDATLTQVDLPDADWYGLIGTPTYGWAPNEAIAADVVIDNQPPQKALVVTDFNQSRIFGFWPSGEHIFTIAIPEPLPGGSYTVGLNGVALTVGGQFKITNTVGADPTLEIVGTLATAWPEYFDLASGGALIYQNTTMLYNAADGQFEAPAPDLVLTGDVAETGDPAIPAVKALTGVTFDSAGNFYMVDSWTGRLHGYNSSFEHQFAYGTPVGDGGTTVEFEEAYGMTLWPGAFGDRLLITLPYQNAAVVYAPSPRTGAPATLQYLFRLDGLGAVAGLPHSSAFDPVNGRVAVSDSGDNSVKVFQTPVLAIFDVQLDGTSNPVAPSVCGGASFEVGFSITVPEGRSPVQNVSPILRLDEVASSVPPAPGDPSYLDIPVPGPLNPTDVISYTYSLTAPNTGLPVSIAFTATASGFTTSVGGNGDPAEVTDIFEKRFTLSVIDCGGGNVAPTITASVPVQPEPSGWTKIVPTLPDPISFAVTLNAADTDGTIAQIWYHVEGTNSIPGTFVAGGSPVAVPLVQPGVSTIFYRAQDDDLQWSPELSLTVRLDNTLPSICLNFPAPQGQKSHTEWWWNGTVTISVVVTDNQDPAPALVAPFPPELVGTDLVFASEAAGQVATLLARDHVGHERLQPSNTTLDVCGTGQVGHTVNIDKTAPTVTADLAVGPVYQSPATVTLSALDTPAPTDGSLSGIRYIDYSFDNFATFTRVAAASVPVVLSESATLSFRSIDWATNASAIQSRTYTVNRPPTITAPPAQVNPEGTVVTLPVSASDPDGQPLTYSAIGLPAWLSINPATGVITGTLSYTAANTYTVTVSVSDGTASDAETFTWVVTDANGAPAAADDTAVVVQGQTVTINVLGNDADPDGTPLTVVSVSAPTAGSVAINPGGTVSYTAPPTFVGAATFTYTVSDGSLTATATVTVNVQPSNLPPICSAAAGSPGSLWPVNHKPVFITVGGLVDPEGLALSVTFTSILQDEPTNSVGQGNTPQDGGIVANGTRAWVRAERAGTKKVPGDGRVYLIGFTATDAGGLSCTGAVYVGVPHDQRGTPAVLSPGRWNSLTGQLVLAPPPPPPPPPGGSNGGHGGPRDDDDDDDCGDSKHDHERDQDGRERDHRRGDHDRCKHRR